MFAKMYRPALTARGGAQMLPSDSTGKPGAKANPSRGLWGNQFVHALATARWRCALLRVAIAWRAVANEIWRIPRPDGKFPQVPEHNGGGFGMVVTRQATRLGMRSALFTTIGEDPSGAMLRKELMATGADTTPVRVAPGPTTQAHVIVCNGNRAVLMDSGRGGAEWRPNGGDWRLMRKVEAICIGGSLPDEVFAETCMQARCMGKPVFANPTGLADISNLDLRGCLLLQVSRSDAANFGMGTRAPAAALADALLKRGPAVVVVTASSGGARAFDQGGHCLWMPAVPGRKALFPTGCGDAHFAGALAGYLGGLTLDDWMNLASLSAAWFLERGRVGSWIELMQLARTWPPQKRLNDG